MKHGVVVGVKSAPGEGTQQLLYIISVRWFSAIEVKSVV
jgi:hypothetical protein